MAEMTRDEMVAVHQRGESVLFRGRLITRPEDLPSEADLSKGDPAKEAAAREALDDQIRALQATRDSLAAPKPPPVQTPAPAPETKAEDEAAAATKANGRGK